jgi:hypothetical protein
MDSRILCSALLLVVAGTLAGCHRETTVAPQPVVTPAPQTTIIERDRPVYIDRPVEHPSSTTSVIERRSDGTTIERRSDGTTIERRPDGTVIERPR